MVPALVENSYFFSAHKNELSCHSRDVKDCGGAPRRKFTLKPARIPYIKIWQHWLGNTKPFQIDPKHFATEFKKIFI